LRERTNSKEPDCVDSFIFCGAITMTMH